MKAMISLILLSGGVSSRFGSPKALVDWNGCSLISSLQERLILTQIDEIIIVLGAHVHQIKPQVLNHNKIRIVYNKNYNLGQTSSLKIGLQQVSNAAEGVGFLPIDFPLILSQTIDDLVSEFLSKRPLILIPSFQGQAGHPPFLDISLRDKILNLPDYNGLNIFLKEHHRGVRYFDVIDSGVVSSFNTPDELKELRNKVA
ncbi:MAG: nucleotidyltransferase family protein [Candidatus Omnitrophica bacterium]|nr:nucleotidyltransferase family protein [Candidatus Omnitrophota bacterium]